MVPHLVSDGHKIQNSSSDSKLCAHFTPSRCLGIFWVVSVLVRNWLWPWARAHGRDPIWISFSLTHALDLRVPHIRPITNLWGMLSPHPFAAASLSAWQEYCVELCRSWFIACSTDRGSHAVCSSSPQCPVAPPLALFKTIHLHFFMSQPLVLPINFTSFLFS